MSTTQQPEALAELRERLRSLEKDHTPNGWPAVRMREITGLLDCIAALETDSATLRTGYAAARLEIDSLRARLAGDGFQSDEWLQDRGLLYRLTDERHPCNRDEINVTMADGSRSLEDRTRRAGELLDCIRATRATHPENFDHGPQATSTEEAALDLRHVAMLCAHTQPEGAQQPGAAYAAQDSEHQRAIMEAERNASLDAYSRVVYLSGAESRLYEAGFTNGWQRASHGQAPAGESLRTDALCDLSYSHGLKAGWNYCASDDLAGFERAQKIGAEALRTLKSPTAQAAPAYKDSTPELHVGDSAFESWYSTYSPAHKADKQRARDAYAAGMGDPLVTAAPAAPSLPSGWSFDVKRSDGRVWLTINTPYGASATLSAAEKTGTGGDTIVAQVLDYFAGSLAAPAAVAGPSEILEKVDTLIASINEAHISKDAEWKRGCFAAADSVYEQIKEMLASAPTTQPAPQQEAQEQAAVPRFNCWTTNDGDSWLDHPADSQAIYDCLGNDAKVGDEYELTAGWRSVTARYRITEVVGDGEEYEVECISHQQENTAPQPASQGDALPTIKGASITGGYVVVTPAGWADDKATVLRDAILRTFPVNPAFTPKHDDAARAAQEGK